MSIRHIADCLPGVHLEIRAQNQLSLTTTIFVAPSRQLHHPLSSSISSAWQRIRAGDVQGKWFDMSKTAKATHCGDRTRDLNLNSRSSLSVNSS
jgi:hypothetical protein